MQGSKHASVAGPPSHRCMTNELGRGPGELGGWGGRCTSRRVEGNRGLQI